jgi:hypothetical protein
MEGDPGKGAAAEGGPGQGAARDGGPGQGAAQDGGPGHGHGAEAFIGGTSAAAYPGKGSDGDASFEGAAARVGTDSGMDETWLQGEFLHELIFKCSRSR